MTEIPGPDPSVLLSASPHPVPLLRTDGAKPRRQAARKPLPLPWQAARWIEVRTAGPDVERIAVDAVALERDWVTVRRDENGGPRVTAYPLWRVTEIELRYPS